VPGRLRAGGRVGEADRRLSFTELARQTGLSVSAVQQRVRRLEERGEVRGYSATIDPEAAGLSLTAFISIKPFDPAAPDDAPERLAHPEGDRGLPQRGRRRERTTSYEGRAPDV
jgi:DNA-binding Lrp family transcriptional regulator